MTIVNNIKFILALFSLFLFNLAIAESSPAYPNFTEIVEKNMPAVVIVNASRSSNATNSNNQFQTPPGMPDEFNDLFKKYFDERNNQPKRSQPSSGSGFILSSDGYIMTNHHVVNGADKINIITNDQTSYEANLIGSDKRSDLALLKVEALTYLL